MSIDERLELIRKARDDIELIRDFIEAELLLASGSTAFAKIHINAAMDAACKLRALRERIAEGAE